MPEIAVIDPTHVTIDGIAAGSVPDILANHDPGVTLNPDAGDNGFRSALLAALIARDNATQQAHAGELQVLSDSQAEALAKLQAEHAEALALRDAAIIAEREQSATTLGAALASAEAKHAEALAAAKAEHERAIADLKAAAKARWADRHAEHARKHASLESRLAAVQATAKEQQDMISALGGTELGQKMAKEARCKKIREARASLKAELAELEGSP